MRVNGERVSFKPEDCESLQTVCSAYVPKFKQALAIEAMPLEELWKKTNGIVMASLAARIHGLKNNTPEERAMLAGPPVADFSGPYLQEVIDVVLGVRDLAFTGNKEQLTQTFLWASTNLVEGSVYIQNVVGGTLNSGYEDHAIAHWLSHTNADYANSSVNSLTIAGVQAGEWLMQLQAGN